MGDLIERNAVLDGLASIAKAKAKSTAQKVMFGRALCFVERLPSVGEAVYYDTDSVHYLGVKEKIGYWKKIKSGDDAFPESLVCSICGCENSYISEWDRNNYPVSKSFRTTRYCPHCGAKMEERNERKNDT